MVIVKWKLIQKYIILFKTVLAVNALAIVISLGPLGMQSNINIVETSKQLVE